MLFRKLPDEICGRKVQTDFRKWMKVSLLLDAPLSGVEKEALLFYNLFGELPKPEIVETMLDGILNFYLCGQKTPPVLDPPQEKILDWERDSDAVWADFKVYVGMDLDKEKLHWWEFMALFQSLPEDASIRKRMEIRAVNLSEIKDPEMREPYRKRKQAVALEEINRAVF